MYPVSPEKNNRHHDPEENRYDHTTIVSDINMIKKRPLSHLLLSDESPAKKIPKLAGKLAASTVSTMLAPLCDDDNDIQNNNTNEPQKLSNQSIGDDDATKEQQASTTTMMTSIMTTLTTTTTLTSSSAPNGDHHHGGVDDGSSNSFGEGNHRFIGRRIRSPHLLSPPSSPLIMKLESSSVMIDSSSSLLLPSLPAEHLVGGDDLSHHFHRVVDHQPVILYSQEFNDQEMSMNDDEHYNSEMNTASAAATTVDQKSADLKYFGGVISTQLNCSDIWMHVVQYVDFETVLKLGKTSRSLKSICYDSNLWQKRIFNRQWKLKQPNTLLVLQYYYDTMCKREPHSHSRANNVCASRLSYSSSRMSGSSAANGTDCECNVRSALVTYRKNSHYIYERLNNQNHHAHHRRFHLDGMDDEDDQRMTSWEQMVRVDPLFGSLRLFSMAALPLMTLCILASHVFRTASIIFLILWMMMTLVLISGMRVPERAVSYYAKYENMFIRGIDLCRDDLSRWGRMSFKVRWHLLNCENRMKHSIEQWSTTIVPYCVLAVFGMRMYSDVSMTFMLLSQSLLYSYPVLLLYLDRSNYMSAHIGMRKLYYAIPLPVIGWLMDISIAQQYCPWYIYAILQTSGLFYLVQGGSYFINRTIAYLQVLQVNYMFHYGTWDSIVFILVTLMPHDEIRAWELFLAVSFVQSFCDLTSFVLHALLWPVPGLTKFLQSFALLRFLWSIRHLLALGTTMISMVFYITVNGERRQRKKKRLDMYKTRWRAPN